MTTNTYGQAEGHLRRAPNHLIHGQSAQLQLVLRVPVVVFWRQVWRGLVCAVFLLSHELIEPVVKFLELRVLQMSRRLLTLLKKFGSAK